MELDEAIEKLLKTQIWTQTPGFTEEPVKISKAMARLSIYAGAVETRLAEYERNYENQSSRLYKMFLIDQKLPATNAEKRVKIELGETKGQIAYLTRIVASAWRQVGVLQSRFNHLVKQSETTNL